MTDAEKIAHLEGVVFLLQQSIYAACSTSGIDIESIDLNNPPTLDSLITRDNNPAHSDWVARHTIIREIEKLNLVKKKLDELKNA
jgi:hypothetical protein